MILSSKKALLREALILLGVLSMLTVSDKMGRIRLGLPFHPPASAHDVLPKYDVADKDSSMALFETGEIFLFAQPPADDEIVKAYLNQKKSPSDGKYKVLYPVNTFMDMWFFHLNNKYGFFDIEIDRAGAWLVMLGYPIYWIIRVMTWLHKDVVRGLEFSKRRSNQVEN